MRHPKAHTTRRSTLVSSATPTNIRNETSSPQSQRCHGGHPERECGWSDSCGTRTARIKATWAEKSGIKYLHLCCPSRIQGDFAQEKKENGIVVESSERFLVLKPWRARSSSKGSSRPLQIILPPPRCSCQDEIF